MADGMRKATHSGTLTIGTRELLCAVLEDGTRVFSMRGLSKALGSARTGAANRRGVTGAPKLPTIMASRSLEPFIDADLSARLTSPIEYRPQHGGRTALGYEATLLPRMCAAILDAKKANALKINQMPMAEAADALLRGFATVGVIALVDEATGYQYTRTRHALEEILDKFIAKELQPWAKRFPDEFYEELFRLREWLYDPGSVKRPSYVGKLTNDLVYARLAPAVLDELRRKNPPDEKGRRKHHHHRWLTEDIGHPKLREHLAAVVALEKSATTWGGFYRGIQRALPKFNQTIPLDLLDKDELEDEKRTGG